MVSVIIPTHNRARMLPDAIQSALTQGGAVGEVVVVDDGSTDDTPRVLEDIQDPRLRVLRRNQGGPAAARDAGWRSACGDWVQFLDSDDLLAPLAMDRLLTVARAQPGRIPFGRSNVHGEDVKEPAALENLAFAHRSGNLLREICFYPAGTILSCLFPKAALEQVGGFGAGEEASHCEDYDLALRVALNFEFACLPEVTYLARMHPGNRHRIDQPRVWAQAIGCLNRHLRGKPGTLLVRRRASAYFLGLQADDDQRQGRTALARQRYLQCLAWWPWKLGAWRGLLRTCTGRPA